MTETKIVTVNGGTEDEVVTETVTVKNQRDELISEIVKVDGEKTICRPPSAGICSGGAAPAPAAAVPRRPAAMLPPPPAGSARNFPSGLAPPGGGRLLAAQRVAAGGQGGSAAVLRGTKLVRGPPGGLPPGVSPLRPEARAEAHLSSRAGGGGGRGRSEPPRPRALGPREAPSLERLEPSLPAPGAARLEPSCASSLASPRASSLPPASLQVEFPSGLPPARAFLEPLLASLEPLLASSPSSPRAPPHLEPPSSLSSA